AGSGDVGVLLFARGTAARARRQVGGCVHVLAFRGRGLGGGLYGGLCDRGVVMDREVERIEVPAPTAWPIVLAFGLALVFAGLVTAAAVSGLGAILAGDGAPGWVCDALPVAGAA